MNVSLTTLSALAILLAVAVVDAGGSSLTYIWIPLLSAGVVIGLQISVPSCRCRISPALLPMSIWLAFLILYVINPSHQWHENVGLLPRSSISFLPSSVHAASSFRAWVILATACCFFLLSKCVRRADLKWLQWGVLAGAALVAFSALNDRLMYRHWPIFERTGPFVYENHYAAFANLLLPVVLAAGLRFHYRAKQRDQLSSPAGVTVLVAVLLAASILVSGSRAGVALLGFSIVMMGGLAMRLRKHENPNANLMTGTNRWLLIGIGLSMTFLVFLALNRYGYSIRGLSHEFNFRFTILTDTWRIWRDSMTWGIGPGTLPLVFPYYQSEALGAVQVAHAHCEPLQWLTEVGWLGLLISGLLVGSSLHVARKATPSAKDRWPLFRDIEGPALAIALMTVGLHSLIDFPWRMPAIVWVTASWVGLVCSQWERQHSQERAT